MIFPPETPSVGNSSMIQVFIPPAQFAPQVSITPKGITHFCIAALLSVSLEAEWIHAKFLAGERVSVLVRVENIKTEKLQLFQYVSFT